jgi:hypothetical protein
MIYHHNRIVFKADVTDAEREEALESLRNQGRVIEAVRHFVVGRDIGEDYEYGAVFAIDDLDGFWEYLTHPAHLNTDRVGLPLVESFVSYDTTDDADPEIGDKIAALHTRRFAEIPDVRDLVAGLPSYTGVSTDDSRD